MAVGAEKERILLTLDKRIINELDNLCDVMGLSRSAFIQYQVGNALLSYKLSKDKLDALVRENETWENVLDEVEKKRS